MVCRSRKGNLRSVTGKRRMIWGTTRCQRLEKQEQGLPGVHSGATLMNFQTELPKEILVIFGKVCGFALAGMEQREKRCDLHGPWQPVVTEMETRRESQEQGAVLGRFFR